MNERRHGRFSVPAEWVREGRHELKQVMACCVVLRAETMFHTDQIEYVAASEHFRLIAQGEVIPEYYWFFANGTLSARETKDIPANEPSWWAAALNRRATVEQWMFDAARGKRPMPTPEELHAWAMKLGTPEPGEPIRQPTEEKPWIPSL